jgi:hypothetical protein
LFKYSINKFLPFHQCFFLTNFHQYVGSHLLSIFVQVPTVREMIEMLKKKHNMFEVVYSWFLAKACFYVWLSYLPSQLHFQLFISHSFSYSLMLYFWCTVFFMPLNFWQVASKLEVFPGSEFRVAYEEAMKYRGRVILGDRPVQVG